MIVRFAEIPYRKWLSESFELRVLHVTAHK
jgi:hypothetical protein